MIILTQINAFECVERNLFLLESHMKRPGSAEIISLNGVHK